MDKVSAVELLSRYLSEKLSKELRVSHSMSEDVSDMARMYLSNSRVTDYSFSKLGNGFYLGEIRDGERNGVGFYYWNPSAGEDFTKGPLYMGGWRNGNKQGEGFHFQSSGVCIHGEYVNDKLHCDHAHVVSGAIDFEGAFNNGHLVSVLCSNASFDYTNADGTKVSYDKERDRITTQEDEKQGCVILIVAIVVVILLLRMC